MKPISIEDVIANIENQAPPVRGWSYVLNYNGKRYMSAETWTTRREVIAALEEDWNMPWSQIKAHGYEAVKVTTYEGWT